MKIIKILSAILFLGVFSIACEADSVNDEVGTEIEEVVGTEDAGTDDIEPVRG